MTTGAGGSLRERLGQVVRFRAEHLQGDEKGQAQVFLDRLFRGFGHEGLHEAGATLEYRIAKRSQKGTAFADLMWKPRCLIEMKKAGTDLARFYRQAFDYWELAVPNRPRYVVLCNFDEFWIYDFDQQLDAPMDRVKLTELPARWEALAFLLPEPEPPQFGNDLVAVTRDAAAKVARVFSGLRERGIAREPAQRFVLQSVVAMFAEDVGLLPAHFFTRALHDSTTGAHAYDLLFGLFREMNTPGDTTGGRYRGTPYFNGGLFDTVAPFDLTDVEIDGLRQAAVTDWSAVRPEIFGTLFERSMDAGERHAWGAHFTSQADIARVVGPTIVDPWRARLAAAGSIDDLNRALAAMYEFKVLDPACGSGNFLYVAYREMRRLEHEALAMIADRRRSGRRAYQSISLINPENFRGIDVNPFAVEVAKVTMMLAKKLAAEELDQGLEVLPLDNLDAAIVAGDALFADWPAADVIIGNPPYLGRRKMVSELGADYTERLAAAYPAIGGVSDFVTYWFPRTHDHLPDGGRAGLVATKTVRETSSRAVSMDYLTAHGGVITDAVSSQAWSGDAVVHVSIINWTKNPPTPPDSRVLWLNGTDLRLELDHIPASLAPGVDVGAATALAANQRPKLCFQGQTPGVTDGFVLDADARAALIRRDPRSEHYIHPFLGGHELLHDLEIDRWVIDLPHTDALDAERDAPVLIEHLRKHVLPVREKAAQKEVANNAAKRATNPSSKDARHHERFLDYWWMHSYRRADMVAAVEKLPRYIALTITASWERPSVYTLVDSSIRPAASLQVFAADDYYSLGVLHSGIHRLWFEARCSRLKADLRYTPNTVFDSFPWPQAPTSAQTDAIEYAVGRLLDIRSSNLAAGLPLAQQYDMLRQPGKSQLGTVHADLDAAVLAAFGFSPDEDLLAQLFALNQDLAEAGTSRGPGRLALS